MKKTRKKQRPRSGDGKTNAARTNLLQRKCACGGSAGLDGECDACRQKRLTKENAAPASVSETIQSPGQRLEKSTRDKMASRLGHDFSRVRVHTDEKAAQSAESVNARAYTVGKEVVFGKGKFAPDSTEGKKLLAHELTHVVQQNAADSSAAPNIPINRDRTAEEEADAISNAASLGGPAQTPGSQHSGVSLQRDENDEEEERGPFQLQTPELRFPQRPRVGLLSDDSRLRLDPGIGAQIRAIAFTRRFLTPQNILPNLLNLNPSLIPRPRSSSPPAQPATQPQSQTPATQPAQPATQPQSQTPATPPQPGPSPPRPGNLGDIWRAISRVPEVNQALTNLRERAAAEVRGNWRQLSTGEKALVVTGAATIAGGALAGALSNAESRDFLLNAIQDRDLPVPGVRGLSVKFRATGDNPMVMFNLNVGRFLPREFGLR